MKKVFEMLINAKNPLYFFDDDPDGLCSFLLFYLYKREGSGVAAKSSPILGEGYIEKSNNSDFDVVFVLDKPIIEDSFFNKVKKQIVWVDHHPVQKDVPSKVIYYNPRKQKKDAVYPTSEICFDVLDKNADKDFLENNKKRMLWLSLIGTVGDWKVPHFINEAKKEFPEMFVSLNGKKIDLKKPEDLLFNTPVGRLVKIFNSILKGNSVAMKKRIKVLTRIKSPYEILSHDKVCLNAIGEEFLIGFKTDAGKFVYKNFMNINEEYEMILKDAIKSFEKQKKKKVLVYSYQSQTSLTSSLSNELYYLYPKKPIIVCRRKSGNMMCSFRYFNGDLPKKIEKALEGLNGYGGGHENASGGNIKESEFHIFIERFEKMF